MKSSKNRRVANTTYPNRKKVLSLSVPTEINDQLASLLADFISWFRKYNPIPLCSSSAASQVLHIFHSTSHSFRSSYLPRYTYFLVLTTLVQILHMHIDSVERLPLTTTGSQLLIRCKTFLSVTFIIPKERECHELYLQLLKLSQPGECINVHPLGRHD